MLVVQYMPNICHMYYVLNTHSVLNSVIDRKKKKVTNNSDFGVHFFLEKQRLGVFLMQFLFNSFSLRSSFERKGAKNTFFPSLLMCNIALCYFKE